MTDDTEEKQYLSVDEAAEEIGWNRATIFDWIKALNLETHRFLRNRKTYMTVQDVERLKDIKAHPWKAGERR